MLEVDAQIGFEQVVFAEAGEVRELFGDIGFFGGVMLEPFISAAVKSVAANLRASCRNAVRSEGGSASALL